MKPAKDSVRWFESEWRSALDDGKEGERLVKSLGQLSYENVGLRRRLDVVEGLLFAMSTGMVRGLDGNPHLLGCQIREGKHEKCDCGSVPAEGAVMAAKKRAAVEDDTASAEDLVEEVMAVLDAMTSDDRCQVFSAIAETYDLETGEELDEEDDEDEDEDVE